ncbi:MAG: hypothetical protein EBR28_04310, partial [Planctomycetia bacterium]|nr:hypothetical protein [Planctomycetia bacterium]
TGDGRSPKSRLKSLSFQEPFGPWAQRTIAAVTGFYAAALVFATHYPKPDELLGRKLPPDKLMHFAAYGALGLLAALLLRARGRLVPRLTPLLFAGLAVAAVLDEATQPLFGRAADPLDWVYDAIGLALGIATIVALNTIMTSTSTRPGRPC